MTKKRNKANCKKELYERAALFFALNIYLFAKFLL